MSWYANLPADLPAGRLVKRDGGTEPAYWISSQPAGRGDWARWRARHAETGLWPVMLLDQDNGSDVLSLCDLETTAADARRSQHVLRELWAKSVPDDDENVSEWLAPHGRRWPGLCPPIPLSADPEAVAITGADTLVSSKSALALIPAPDGARALTALPWTGPLNLDNDTGLFASVVSDWQERFGARVIGLSLDVLILTVAAAPRTRDEALAIAAEHFAFCPDIILQGAGSISDYADSIQGDSTWGFWWD